MFRSLEKVNYADTVEGSKNKIYWRETQNNCITESPAAIYPHSSSGLEAFSAIQKKTKFKFAKF
jgi:hypothetical protein